MTRRRDRQPEPEPRSSDRTVLGLIKDLQAGHVSGGALAAGDRRRVVEHLWAEGYSVPEIAEVVKATERTVHRDRQAIRQANALEVHDGLVPEMVGGLVRQAEVAIGRLRRVARDRETAAATKVDAELGCWQVGRELVETLQRLGYLPTAPHELRAAVRVDGPPEFAELQRELERVEGCVGIDGVGAVGGSELRAQFTRVKETLVRLAPPPPPPPPPPPSTPPTPPPPRPGATAPASTTEPPGAPLATA